LVLFKRKFVKETLMSEFFDNITKDQLANKVWFSKYTLRDKHGNILENTPQEGITRILNEIVRIDTQLNDNEIDNNFARRIEDYLNNGVIIPSGSNLYGIGNNHSVVSLSNCFVISGNGEDSYGSIFRSDQEIVQIAKRRGGVGLDISHLRPALSPVNNSAQSSTGAVSFAPRFSHSIREVAQDGRRGALMLTISINHPDSPTFVSMKSDTTSVTGANVSLKITDEFMRAATNAENNDFILRFPVDTKPQPEICLEYDTLYTSPDGTMHKKIDAKKLFDLIVHNAWAYAEPGLLFWDNVLRTSVPDVYDKFQTVSTNPCGEIRLK
jgi:ribonucleoside-diphosphate reductase alpha chain